MSNIKQTKDGLVEKSTGRKIVSPLDPPVPIFHILGDDRIDLEFSELRLSQNLIRIIKHYGYKVNEIEICKDTQFVVKCSVPTNLTKPENVEKYAYPPKQYRRQT